MIIDRNLPKVSSAGEDMLQSRVDATNSCRYLFYYYPNSQMIDISKLDTSNVTDMQSMFANCSSLTSLNTSNFNTSKVKFMGQMFSGCSSLTSLDLSHFDTNKVVNTNAMFNNCSKLTNITLTINHGKMTNVGNMFQSCKALETITGVINLLGVTVMTNVLNSCTNIKSFTFTNIQKNFQIGSGTSWGTFSTDDTIVNTFQELHDLTGGTTQTLTLSTASNARTEAIYVKLIDVTDEMIANDPYITSKKPCVVCESTDDGAMTLKEYGISKNWNIA